MRRNILFLVPFLLCPNIMTGQMLEEKNSYPGVRTIKGKYFNGSGGSGYWSFEKLDSIGRTIEKENYRKKKLLSREKFIYNSNNDKLYKIIVYNINDPIKTDTIVKYEYKYDSDMIVYQKSNFSKNDSTIIRLVENRGDTILIYKKQSYYFRPNKNTTDVYEEIYSFIYKNKRLTCFEIHDLNDNSKRTTYYNYFPNGKLKRRKIERNPMPDIEVRYVGGTDSDDMSYEYKLDEEGRIQNLYYLINEKKYKIATYKYNK
jgi:hypothetical protein